MQEQSSKSPTERIRWLCDLLILSGIPLILFLAFLPVFLSGASISKMDLLKGVDYWQNVSATGPLVYTDDPSTALTHVPNEVFAAY